MRRTGTAPSRRELSFGALAGAVLVVVPPVAQATPDELADTLKQIAKGAAITPGRVKLTMPELAENGNVVSTVIEVQSPMTSADHVKTIHVLAEKNPQVTLIRFHLGPRAGRAKVAANVRLADTQRVMALAEMSDGTFWSGEATVIVTLAACVDSG